MENTPYYDPKFVIYERKMFIRLATEKKISPKNVEGYIDKSKKIENNFLFCFPFEGSASFKRLCYYALVLK